LCYYLVIGKRHGAANKKGIFNMRVSGNFSKTGSAMVLGAEPEATRCRLKMAEDGSVMLMPTSRMAVNNLPKEELKARRLTRDKRKNTLSLALNVEGISEGIYVLTPGKHRWFSMKPYEGVGGAPLGLATVMFSKKSG
jgi:hypothetical protein